jgi:DNA-binding response OmpR family regulator
MDNSAVEILFIEDNHHEAELAIRSLKKHNLANNLKHIDDGAVALEFIFTKCIDKTIAGAMSPNLIILDLKLPKIDGIEILRKLKSDERTMSIPVVILTSSQEEKDIIESYKLGANSYVVKPMSFDSFSKAVIELGLYWTLLNQKPNI